MKSLKSDTLDLLSAAVQHRLRSLLDDMVMSRNHRLVAQPARPPPMHDFDPLNSEALPTAMWDEVLQPDAAKILAIIDRVEKEEERLARRERAAREVDEQNRIEMEKLAQKSESEDEKGGKNGKKGTKKKPVSVTHTARNLPEEMQKKMTDKTAQATLFGKKSKYGWMQGNSASTSTLNKSTSDFAPARGNPLAQSLTAASQLPLQYGVEVTDRLTHQDLEFALEHERGSGAGIGTGSSALYKALAQRRR